MGAQEPSKLSVRCPNGHELRAAPAHLGQQLSCPICNAVFVATVPGTGPAVPTLGYAGVPPPERLRWLAPVRKPAYVSALIGAWLVATGVGLVGMLLELALPPPRSDAISELLHPAFLTYCAGGVVMVVAIVLQLMRIHRIHADAHRRGGYSRVSPGMALGLSFIPLFNYVWTAWTMVKLAGFATRPGPTTVSQETSISSLRKLIWRALGIWLVSCALFLAGLMIELPAEMAAGWTGTAPTPPLANALYACASIIGLPAVILYCLAVYRLTNVLYERLTPSSAGALGGSGAAG